MATITLNNPERYNSFFGPTNTSELFKCPGMCHKDREIRVVVLTGSGKAFVPATILVIFEKKFASSDPSQAVRGNPWTPAPDCAGDTANAKAGAGCD